MKPVLSVEELLRQLGVGSIRPIDDATRVTVAWNERDRRLTLICLADADSPVDPISYTFELVREWT